MGGREQTRGIDARVSELAEQQYVVVELGQLRRLGVSKREVERRLAAGRLHQLYRGVYAVGHRVLPREAHWLAATKACGPHAVLSRRSAAAHWGFRSYSGAYVDITSPSKAKSRGSIRRHPARLHPDEVTERERIPITTVPRTIFDLARESTPQTIESCLRQCEYLRLYDSLSLWDLIERHPRHRGNKSVRIALSRLEETPGEVNEGLEERFLAFLDTYALLRPELNAWIFLGERRYKADCLWRQPKLIAELDSWQAHGTRQAFRSDKTRDRHLLLAGYTTVRIAWSHLDNEPELLAADLRRLLDIANRTPDTCT